MMSTSLNASTCSALCFSENWSVVADAVATLGGVARPRSEKNFARVSWVV